MNAILSKLLHDYKKSNKAAREKMIARWGFSTEEEFLASLQETPNLVESVVAPSGSTEPEKPLDMVVAFDCTGSMNSYIASVRQHVETLVKDLFTKTPNLRMKIVAFGDYCDPEDTRFQYTQLTNDQATLIEFVKKARNTGGGDSNEFYEYVIKRVVEETDWRKDSQKSFLLIGDDAPHPVGYTYKDVIKKNKIDWKIEAIKASKLGIQIDTLRIHPNQQWYQELASMTGGVCMEFSNAHQTSAIVEGLAYVRGSKASFMATLDSVMKSDDEELKGAYKTISKLL